LSNIHGSGSRFNHCCGENGTECCPMKVPRFEGGPENSGGNDTSRTVEHLAAAPDVHGAVVEALRALP